MGLIIDSLIGSLFVILMYILYGDLLAWIVAVIYFNLMICDRLENLRGYQSDRKRLERKSNTRAILNERDGKTVGDVFHERGM